MKKSLVLALSLLVPGFATAATKLNLTFTHPLTNITEVVTVNDARKARIERDNVAIDLEVLEQTDEDITLIASITLTDGSGTSIRISEPVLRSKWGQRGVITLGSTDSNDQFELTITPTKE